MKTDILLNLKTMNLIIHIISFILFFNTTWQKIIKFIKYLLCKMKTFDKPTLIKTRLLMIMQDLTINKDID